MPTKKILPIGVVLMTYGSATTSKNAKKFLEDVYPNGPDKGLVKEFQRRFDLVGGSPLIEITLQQGHMLQTYLDKSQAINNYVVGVGFLHSPPAIDLAVTKLKAVGARKLIGIILSPQFSKFIMGGYAKALQLAAEKNGFGVRDISIAGPWPEQPDFINLLSGRLVAKHRMLTKKYRQNVPIIFTTHSLPKRVVDKDPDYLKQLEKTMRAIVKKSKLSKSAWSYAYQSAGHTPEEWLKPDLVDILAEFKPIKVPAVLIVPLQFLADHLEILYDLDIAAKEQCEESNISYNRIELPNTDPMFIKTLASLVARQS